VHARLRNVFDDHRDVEVPRADRFIVRRCKEPPVFVDKGDRIYGAQMLVVLLGYLARVDIVLSIYVSRLKPIEMLNGPYLDYLFVVHAS
jgi:hypothetical protein